MTFEQYVTDAQRGLFRFAVLLCSDPVHAEDIVAEVLARAFERWDRVGAANDVNAYVRRMVVNEFISRRRRLARTSPRSDVADIIDRQAIGRHTAAPDHGTEHAERSAMIAALDRLPRKQRAAIVLRFYEALPDDEIANVLGCRAGTVRSNISRGLATLRVDIGADLTVPAPAIVSRSTDAHQA